MDESDIDEIEQSALRLLAGREHSRAELRHKLAARAAAPQLIERVLDRLAACNAQNDRRFTEEYIAARQRRGFGPLRISRELREKGLAPDLIGECLDRHDPVWERALLEAVRRKFGPAGAGDYREWARRARFLEYRGFAPEDIRRLLQADPSHP